MRVSTLRSTTREDDVSDKECISDDNDNYTPIANLITLRVTRASKRPSRACTTANNTTATTTAATTPSTKPKPIQKDDASIPRPKVRGTAVISAGAPAAAAAPQQARRSRRKRAPSPELDAGDQSGGDESNNFSENEQQLTDSRQPQPRRRSRSLSVIPTVSMPPLTHPAPEDSAVHTLGLSQSARPGAQSLSFDPEQLVRMREGHFFRPRPERKQDIKRNWRHLSLSEAIWTRLEEVGSVGKGRAWTAREGYDEDGMYVKPELPYVMLTKLVIASSPRKMLTLNQIYQAMEERWPYFRTLGQTFRNSIRHNLSMNHAFVNVERATGEPGGMGGKGGHWRVSENTASSHRGRAKKARIEPPKAIPKTVRTKATAGKGPTGGKGKVSASRLTSGPPVSRGPKKPAAGNNKHQSGLAMMPPPSHQYPHSGPPPHGLMYPPHPPGAPVTSHEYAEPDRVINNTSHNPNDHAYPTPYHMPGPPLGSIPAAQPSPGPCQSEYHHFPIPPDAQIGNNSRRIYEPTNGPSYGSGHQDHASHEHGYQHQQHVAPHHQFMERSREPIQRLSTSPVDGTPGGMSSHVSKKIIYSNTTADHCGEFESYAPWGQSQMPTPPYEHDDLDRQFSLWRPSVSPPSTSGHGPLHKFSVGINRLPLPGVASILHPPLSPNSETSTSTVTPIPAKASVAIPLPAWA